MISLASPTGREPSPIPNSAGFLCFIEISALAIQSHIRSPIHGRGRNGNSRSRTGHPRTVPSMVQAEPSLPFSARRSDPSAAHNRPQRMDRDIEPRPCRSERQLQGHIERTDRIVALAEDDNWPEINDDEIEAVAEGWWRLFQLERSRLITNPQGLPSWPNGRERLDDINPELWALASGDDLSRSVRRFLAGPRVWRYPQAPDGHHSTVGGASSYCPPG